MRALASVIILMLLAIVPIGVVSATPDDRSTRDKWSKQQAAPAQDKKDEPKYKPWGEVTKDATQLDGVVTLYQKGEDLFLEVREDQFNKPMVNFMNISSGIGTGWVLGGMPLGILETVMFDFNHVDDHIQIRKLNPLFTSGGDPAIADAIDLSYGNSIMASLPIASEKSGDDDAKSYLIKVNSFFLSDISDIGDWIRVTINKPVRLDKKKATFGYLAAYPENVEIEAMLTYMPGDRRGLNLPSVPDSRFIEVGVRYSIRMLPEEPMAPRAADDRVGYYMSVHKDFSLDSNESFFVYDINRWRMEKKDPSAAMSEPVKQIVYYLDPTIPEQYRPYVKQGIEMWQKAFEAAGFKNAIIAKEVGDDPDYNAEDSRYNTIRWIVSDRPSFGAIGPHRTDPRTGEILESDILMEQSMIAGFHKNYRRYAGPDPTMAIMNEPIMMFLRDPAEDPEAAAFMEVQQKMGYTFCEAGMGMSLNIGLLQLAFLMDTGMDVPEEYVGEAIADVTAHEVGHGLGLRHNFKSSTAVPYDKLQDKQYTMENGLIGSIMDYGPVNVSRDRSNQGYYWMPSIGTYDQWVIRYGYTDFGDMSAQQQQQRLMAIANDAPQKINTYGTDEDTYPAGAMDPGCMIWDLSDDPMAWADERMGLCQDLLTDPNLVDRVVPMGDNYVPLRNAVVTLLIQEYLAASRAVRYVGAYETARPHRGDGGGEAVMAAVPRDQQERAMSFLTSNVFAKDAFALSPELIGMMQQNKMRDWSWSPWTQGRRFDFPMTSWVAALQNGTMFQLLHPMRMQRIVEMQYSTDGAYTLSEMFSALSNEIWYDNMVASGRTATMQRNLQQMYVNYLSNIIAAQQRPNTLMPAEAAALARLQLTRIDARIDRTYQQSGLTDETNAHLLEAKAHIGRTLNAKTIAN